MKATRFIRLLFVLTTLALFSCGQTVVRQWMPPPGTSYSTLHAIWRVDCRFHLVEHLHGVMAPDVFDLRGNLYRNTWLQIQQTGPTDFRFGFGAIPGSSSREEGGLFWLTLSAMNGSISGTAGQGGYDNAQERATLVSATGTYTERTLNLDFLWQIDRHPFDSAYIERGTCTATRDHDW